LTAIGDVCTPGHPVYLWNNGFVSAEFVPEVCLFSLNARHGADSRVARGPNGSYWLEVFEIEDAR